MTMHKTKVLLFEDNARQAKKLLKLLNSYPGICAIPFEPAETESSKAYEDRLSNELSGHPYADTALIVCDRDLSGTTQYPGLSEAIVSKVAARLNLPICLYAAGALDPVLERQRNWGDGRIVLESSPLQEMVRRIDILANGFQKTRTLYKRLRGSHRFRDLKTPSAVMAEILGPPSSQIRLPCTGRETRR